MIVSGGGLNVTTGEREHLPGDYLVNHKYLRNRFRFHFLEELKKLKEDKSLRLTARAALDFSEWIATLKQQKWIIAIQPPLHDRKHIVQYVGRYTKRACLSEYRLKTVAHGLVRFTFKDYRNSDRNGPVKEATKQMDTVSFLDQLLQHVPEKGFRMVRDYGLYSNHYRNLRGTSVTADTDGQQHSSFEQHLEFWQEVYQQEGLYCTSCQQLFVYIGQFFGQKPNGTLSQSNQYHDSS